jgi:hypothetical protein
MRNEYDLQLGGPVEKGEKVTMRMLPLSYHFLCLYLSAERLY